MNSKICACCGIEKLVSDFHTRLFKSGNKGWHSDCKECFHMKSLENQHSRLNDYYSKARRRRKMGRHRWLVYYSNGTIKCACCGEKREEFLTFDHINNDGAEHRREIGRTTQHLLKYFKDNNGPPGFQVLCFNCNCAKEYSGYCPHERERQLQLTNKEESYELPLFAGLI